MESARDRVIMGIDPGTNRMGYAILHVSGRKMRCDVLGCIELGKLKDPYAKLNHIFERVTALVEQYSPEEVALEAPFFGENVQSMLKLGRAQGVAMAAALHLGRQVFEYAPSRVKQSIAGRGNAAKEQIASILSNMLAVDYDPRRLDATDALAVALCHHFATSSPINLLAGERKKALGGGIKALSKGGSSSWESFIRANPEREAGNEVKRPRREVKKPL